MFLYVNYVGHAILLAIFIVLLIRTIPYIVTINRCPGWFTPIYVVYIALAPFFLITITIYGQKFLSADVDIKLLPSSLYHNLNMTVAIFHPRLLETEIFCNWAPQQHYHNNKICHSTWNMLS